MRRLVFFALAIFFLSSCSDLEKVEVKEGNVVIESYTRKKSDFAKQGTYTRFSSEGKMIEKSEYENDQLHGKQEFFFPSGKVQEVFHYQNGKHHGEYQNFYENGKLQQEANYVNGAFEGEFKVYYKSGKLKEVVTMKNNEENGPFKEYHENGKLKTEGSYNGVDAANLGIEHGELKKYDENGEHFQTMNCTNGRCITSWLKEGVEINIE